LILLHASKIKAAQDPRDESSLESSRSAFSSEGNAGSREENAAKQ
jgi:hypothetical protein